jgi:hypothetical protein
VEIEIIITVLLWVLNTLVSAYLFYRLCKEDGRSLTNYSLKGLIIGWDIIVTILGITVIIAYTSA